MARVLMVLKEKVGIFEIGLADLCKSFNGLGIVFAYLSEGFFDLGAGHNSF